MGHDAAEEVCFGRDLDVLEQHLHELGGRPDAFEVSRDDDEIRGGIGGHACQHRGLADPTLAVEQQTVVVDGLEYPVDEPIPPDVLRGCYEAISDCDLMIVAGTSATVYPAAHFPIEVRQRGGTLIEVNPYESELTPLCSISLRGPM